jgi:hypothetical protein
MRITSCIFVLVGVVLCCMRCLLRAGHVVGILLARSTNSCTVHDTSVLTPIINASPTEARYMLLQTYRAALMARHRRHPFRTAIKFVAFCVQHLSMPLAIYFAAANLTHFFTSGCGASRSAAQKRQREVLAATQIRQGSAAGLEPSQGPHGSASLMTAGGAGKDLMRNGLEAAGR